MSLLLIFILVLILILIAYHYKNRKTEIKKGGDEKDDMVNLAHEILLEQIIDLNKKGGNIEEDYKLKEELRKEFINKNHIKKNEYKEPENGPDFCFHTPKNLTINGKKQLVNWVSLEPYSYIDLPIVNKHLKQKLEQYDKYGVGCFVFPFHTSTDTLQLNTLKGNIGCFITSII